MNSFQERYFLYFYNYKNYENRFEINYNEFNNYDVKSLLNNIKHSFKLFP